MKKVIWLPFRVIWFALKNDMYSILFPVAVVIAGIAWGIASGDAGKGILSAAVILIIYGITKAIWNRIRRIGGETREDIYRRIQKREKRKELIRYVLK